MPDTTKPDISSNVEVQRVKFHYEKSNFFRVIHVDGALGGLTPTLDIFVSLYNQRAPIPKLTVQRVKPDGQLGDEILEERQTREGIFREVEVGLVMNLSVAKALRQWLSEKIEIAEKTQQQIQGGPPQTAASKSQ